MIGSEVVDDPVFTTHARGQDSPSTSAVRKAVAIARNAILERMAHSASKGRRYVAENSYDDKSQFLSCSLVRANANYGWVNYACDSERFEVRVFSGQRRSNKPVVTVRERHPIGCVPPRLDRDEIVALLDRWATILQGGDGSPHENWSLASNYVAALAKENGAESDLPEPHHLVLPSAYAPGRIQVNAKIRNRPGAWTGLDLDLSHDGEISRMISSLCHSSRVDSKCIDHRGDTRIECDLSGPVRLKMAIPDPMSALRALAEAHLHSRNAGVAMAA